MSRSNLLRLHFVELFGQARFLSGCGFLVHRACGSGLVKLLGDKPKLFGRRLDVAGLQSGFKMFDLRLYPALASAIGRPVLDVLFGPFLGL